MNVLLGIWNLQRHSAWWRCTLNFTGAVWVAAWTVAWYHIRRRLFAAHDAAIAELEARRAELEIMHAVEQAREYTRLEMNDVPLCRIPPALFPVRTEHARPYDPAVADLRARLNLEVVMRATGAKFVPALRHSQCFHEPVVRLETLGRAFILDHAYIRQELTAEDGKVYYDSGTCYQIAGTMPSTEKIATALLLLHNDPSLFAFWCCRQGEWRAR